MTHSTISQSLPPLIPTFPRPSSLTSPPPEAPTLAALISTLKLQPHIEGGYFAETDRDPLLVPNPFPASSSTTTTKSIAELAGLDPHNTNTNKTRNASTSIYYLLTPGSPLGAWHRNAGRTVHTLHWGRGRYVIIHADEEGEEKRIETFVVGKDVQAGERLQWIVEGGKFKTSFLLPDGEGEGSEGLLISEVSLLYCLQGCSAMVWGLTWCDGRLWFRVLNTRIMIS